MKIQMILIILSLVLSVKAYSCPIDAFLNAWETGQKDYPSYMKLVSADELCVDKMVQKANDGPLPLIGILIANQQDTSSKDVFFATTNTDARMQVLSYFYALSRNSDQVDYRELEHLRIIDDELIDIIRLSGVAGHYAFQNLLDLQIAARDSDAGFDGIARLFRIVFPEVDPRYFLAKVKLFHQPENADHPMREVIMDTSMQMIGMDTFKFLESFPFEEQPELWQSLLMGSASQGDSIISDELAQRISDLYLKDSNPNRRHVLLQFAGMLKATSLTSAYGNINLDVFVRTSIILAMQESEPEFIAYLSKLLATSSQAYSAVAVLFKTQKKSMFLKATGILLKMPTVELQELIAKGNIEETLHSFAAFNPENNDIDIQSASLAVLSRAGEIPQGGSYLIGLRSSDVEVRKQILTQGASETSPLFVRSLSRVLRSDPELKLFALDLAATLIRENDEASLDSLPLGVALLRFKQNDSSDFSERDLQDAFDDYVLKSRHGEDLLTQGIRHSENMIAERAKISFVKFHEKKASDFSEALYTMVRSHKLLSNTQEFDIKLQTVLQNLSAYLATDHGDEEAKLLRLLPLENLAPALENLQKVSKTAEDENIRKQLQTIIEIINLKH